MFCPLKQILGGQRLVLRKCWWLVLVADILAVLSISPHGPLTCDAANKSFCFRIAVLFLVVEIHKIAINLHCRNVRFVAEVMCRLCCFMWLSTVSN
jgi:hypothetical protein